MHVVTNADDCERVLADGSLSDLIIWFERPADLGSVGYIDYHEQYIVHKAPPKRKVKMWRDLQDRFVTVLPNRRVCRIKTVHLSREQNVQERYALRLLLLDERKCRCRSFENLCEPSSTFMQEAIRLGLFSNDREIFAALQDLLGPDVDAQSWRSHLEMRTTVTRVVTAERFAAFFVTFLLVGAPLVIEAFEAFWPYLLRHVPVDAYNGRDASRRRVEAVDVLASLLLPHRLRPTDFGLPTGSAERCTHESDVDAERNRYPEDELRGRQSVPLSDGQRALIAAVLTSDGGNKLWYVRGPAGSGKHTL